jgi:hypothetical protein
MAAGVPMTRMATLPALGFVVAFLAAGCATWGWYRPETTAQQFNEDRFYCLSASRVPVPAPGLVGASPVAGGFATGYAAGYNSTMLAYGPTVQAIRQQNELFDACMQARGYRWELATDTWGRPIPRPYTAPAPEIKQ